VILYIVNECGCLLKTNVRFKKAKTALGRGKKSVGGRCDLLSKPSRGRIKRYNSLNLADGSHRSDGVDVIAGLALAMDALNLDERGIRQSIRDVGCPTRVPDGPVAGGLRGSLV